MRTCADAIVQQVDPDGHGQAHLALLTSGYYLVKAMHAEPAPSGSGVTKWVSYWALSTFRYRLKN